MISKEKQQQMDDFWDIYDDLPDGAFFAIAEEQGITTDDWAEWKDDSEEIEKEGEK